MDHKNVNMAILVQPYLDKQATGVKVHYNGVCITHDVARHKVKHGFLVNWYALLESYEYQMSISNLHLVVSRVLISEPPITTKMRLPNKRCSCWAAKPTPLMFRSRQMQPGKRIRW